MLPEFRQDRLFNAIAYFVANVEDCSAEKLAHLLYLLDFKHYAATGRSVTGNAYCALASGPVPAEVHFALVAPAGTPTVLDGILDMDAWRLDGRLIAKAPFKDEDLTQRQVSLLATLAQTYKHGHEVLRAAVRAPGGPWAGTYRNGAGLQSCILYELALEGAPNREQILESAREHEMREAARAASASR